MAITSAEIHNQSFSIDRKGYDVDEVDVFLEHVADEIDGMNAQIAQLENQLDDRKFEGFDTPARVEAPVVVTDDAALAEKDARIADLERQLEAKKADDNAIAQALIIAQRSADEIIANANAQAAATIKDAEDEGTRIVDKAEAERQKVLDAIKKLEDDREDVREDYRDLLTDFIGDATRKLAEIGGAHDRRGRDHRYGPCDGSGAGSHQPRRRGRVLRAPGDGRRGGAGHADSFWRREGSVRVR